jgi:ATP-dependent RNA helicase RhlE
VFTRTKHGANRLAQQLEKDGLSAAAIHGNKSQGARTRALAGFKSGDVRVLVATDIAARGLDIDQLPHVVNFELPNVSEDYVHRIGRTGRAGNEGEAVSLVCVDELKLLRDIERLLKRDIPKEIIPGYEVDPSIKAEPIQRGRGSRNEHQGKSAKSRHRGNEQNRSSRQSASKKKANASNKRRHTEGSAPNEKSKQRSDSKRSANKSRSSAKPQQRRRSNKSRGETPALLGGG